MRIGQALVLNKHYFPVGVNSYHNVLRNIASGTQAALDITYKTNDAGTVDLQNIEHWTAINSLEQWMELPVRPFDSSIGTVNGRIRLPSVVVCTNYNQIRNAQVKFPTKRNIWERDDNTCVYTGKKLTEDELSVDHVIPKSKGGDSSWENLVTCERALNTRKGDLSLEEARLKLRYKPFRPADNVFKFKVYKDEWFSFVANL